MCCAVLCGAVQALKAKLELVRTYEATRRCVCVPPLSVAACSGRTHGS